MKYRKAFAALAVSLAAASVSVVRGQAPAAPDTGMQRDMAEHKDMTQTEHASIRGSKLIGLEVYNRQDKHLGEVKDVVLNSDGQRAGYAIVSYGGFLGVGSKLFAIPYGDVSYSGTKGSRAYVDLDESVLKGGPSFESNRWPEKADATGYYTRVDEYYRGHSARPAGARMDSDTGVAGQIENATWDRRLSNLIGANVVSPEGQSLGEIKDVVLDWTGGKIKYDVLSFGGVLGMGDKLFAIPADQFKAKPDSKELVLAIDKDRLKTATGFDKNSWPDMADTKWWQTNDQFYGTPH